jgi:hypothetical protein
MKDAAALFADAVKEAVKEALAEHLTVDVSVDPSIENEKTYITVRVAVSYEGVEIASSETGAYIE